ncbi:DNA segregation ATPase FtsK/SpoIIIE, S-DNA-T family [Isorropodon fossajaponicum endosymbiont JTNG4]|uniref:DNA translocase FtsK n=1 Tax=Isorropodon fossajaponicum symbiont TaxID=883811 RepID=UPI0019165DD4|nr:DNA translocase FtsK [Isorropodon fossajaponicum symbiont]BBB23977.1 DNA segregation ATPase FtsK/SpoIIIE, S-DNA-T family [Isorropodon fossajaponicum endosymbiont JTNG4]
MKKNNKISTKRYPQKPRTKITSEILFIFLSTVGFIFLSALLTHSTNENPWSGDVALIAPVANLAGVFGAYLSDISLSILGYSAYLIPISLMWLGWNIHKHVNQERPKYSVATLRFIALIALIAFSAAFLTQNFADTGVSGGYIGITMHRYFGVLFGSAALIIYLGIMMISLSIASSTSWINILSSTGGMLNRLFTKMRDMRTRSKTKRAIKISTTSKQSNAKPSVLTKIKKGKEGSNKNIKKAASSNLFNTTTITGLPSLDLLDEPTEHTTGYSKQALEDMSRQVEIKLKDFGFDVSVTTVTPGPVVTQFEISLAPGVKVSQIMNLNKDLARALLVEGVRIVDVIPGKPVIGLEIPNAQREMISLKEILASENFIKSSSALTMGLGKDINGIPIIANLAKMPHLLVAGATGMGKSVGLNAMILSVLFKAKPEEVRIIMIDPKIVELACYADIPHLLTPVVTDMNQATSALWWCVNEMERRYSLLAKFGVRNIEGFNEKLKKSKDKGEPLLDPSFNPNTADEDETAPELEALPLIMLVIDEYADMLGALAQEDRAKAKRVEALIVRLAQKARAAGIHIIIATQRPSVDVITGLIKSNIPTRIAFKVSSKVDSRTILDQGGAEQLLGMGDMLYMTPGMSHLTRVHGAFVDDGEIERVVNFLKENSETNYLDGILNTHSESDDSQDSNSTSNASGELDALYDEAVQIVTSSRRASISSLQRRMRIGYNRAARIIEDMEASGVVSSMNSAGNRQVLAPEPINTND